MNKQDEFQEYSEKYIHFIDSTIPEILKKLIENLNEDFSILDLGCGDGRFLYALYQNNLLSNAKKVVGVDLAKKRIDRLKQSCPFAEGLVSDVCHIEQIANNSFSMIISSHVIEHVSDDTKMLKEVYRILKPKRYFYVSTVIKKRHGFWIYWNNGFKCDPTHIREYKSSKDFLNLLKRNRFEIVEWKLTKVHYALLDLIIRIFIKLDLIKPQFDFYLKHATLRKLRRLINLRVIGFQTIEVLSKVSK